MYHYPLAISHLRVGWEHARVLSRRVWCRVLLTSIVRLTVATVHTGLRGLNAVRLLWRVHALLVLLRVLLRLWVWLLRLLGRVPVLELRLELSGRRVGWPLLYVSRRIGHWRGYVAWTVRQRRLLLL